MKKIMFETLHERQMKRAREDTLRALVKGYEELISALRKQNHVLEKENFRLKMQINSLIKVTK